MSKKVIQTTKAPKALGPYSQAIMVDGFIFCSGQVPISPETGEVICGDVGKQTEQVMKNLRSVLEAAGATFDDVVKSTIFLQNLNDFAAVNEMYGSFLKEPYPARATVQVAKLPLGVDVEIEMVAKVNP